MANMRVKLTRVPTEVLYLVIVDQMLKKYRDLIIERPNEKFENMVRKEVMTHIIDGTAPPKQIRTAVLNAADDMMAGRDVALRAGDYIALMDYAREKKLL